MEDTMVSKQIWAVTMEPVIGEADFDQAGKAEADLIGKRFNKIPNHAEYYESTEYSVMRANNTGSGLAWKGKETG